MPDELNLLAMLEGHKSEDLSTECLAFILAHPSFRAAQQVFYAELLEDRSFAGTAERAFTVSTQFWCGSERPDLRIAGAHLCVLIENKFTAGYTEGQIKRYADLLQTEKVESKMLVLLCPQIWRTEYVRLAGQQFGMANVTEHELRKNLALAPMGITFKVLSWERLLELIGSQDILTAELTRFVRSRYLHSIVFSRESLRMLMSSEIPDELERIFRLVDRVRDALHSLGLKTGSSSSALRWCGFYIDELGWQSWFGYSLLQWSRLHSPVVLQIVKSPDGTSVQQFASALTQLGFVKGEDESRKTAWYWKAPLMPDDESLARTIASAIREKCISLAQAVPASERA